MSYPYPQLLQLLHHQVSAQWYQRIVQQYMTSTGLLKGFNRGTDYWQMLPSYLFARCPLCQEQWQEQIDVYSLLGWSSTHTALGCTVYDFPNRRPKHERDPIHNGCLHCTSVHLFLSLHGNLPVEIPYLANNTGEVPRITRWALPDDIESYVIIHALPICRIETEQFIPSYTLFIMTYFSVDPQEIIRRHYAIEAERGKGDREYYPAGLDRPDMRSLAEPYYDLQTWATQGRLGYLDFTDPDLALRIGSGNKLPTIYQKIPGARYTFTWRKGIFETSVNGRKVICATLP